MMHKHTEINTQVKKVYIKLDFFEVENYAK